MAKKKGAKMGKISVKYGETLPGPWPYSSQHVELGVEFEGDINELESEADEACDRMCNKGREIIERIRVESGGEKFFTKKDK
jgi:hypothetical protein